VFALILAGGRGTRFGACEKPLALCRDRPLLEYVVDAAVRAGCDVAVVASPCTPFTQNWCRAHDLLCVCTEGAGYVEDLREAISLLSLDEPVLCLSADLPCITSELIERIVATYEEQDRPALSVWYPVDSGDRAVPYIDEVDGCRAAPAGINIIHGGRVSEEQDEFRLVIHDPALCHNVNTMEAHRAAETYLSGFTSSSDSERDHRKMDIERNER
jgi:adenosylcobinamide-phosphate guanylyltransferase